MDPIAAGALFTSITTALLGVAAFAAQRREKHEALSLERKSDAYMEMQAGLAEQREMIDVYRMENSRQAAVIAQFQVQLTACDAKARAALQAHADCEVTVASLERRVHVAEARIAEMGG